MNAQILAPEHQSLVTDSARWRLLSMLFECPSAAWSDTLTSLASIIPDADLKEAAEAAQTEASEGMYYSLFGPGGPASPREVSYHRSVELGSLMAELTSYYDFFGYGPASGETCDHIAVETGFVGYLRLKEAYALACDDSEHAQITADAARHFIEGHLAAIAKPLSHFLQGAGVRYLALAAQALIHKIPKC